MNTNKSNPRAGASRAGVLSLIKSIERLTIPDPWCEGIWKPADAFVLFAIPCKPPLPVSAQSIVDRGAFLFMVDDGG